MKRNIDYLIVGAGLYGVVFAERMTGDGKECLMSDKRSHITENVYTKEVEGIYVHQYGAYVFHTNDEEVWNYVKWDGIEVHLILFEGKVVA